MPPLMCTAPPCDYKRRRWASFSQVGLSLSGFSLPRECSTTTKYSSQPTLLLAETWELPSLSRLACTPYYKHSGCKIIQCPRTPPLLDVRPRGRNQDKPCYCDCLLHHHLGQGNTQHLLVGIRTPGLGHRQLARQVGARCVTFSLSFPFDLQGWRADPTHAPWVFRIRFQQDA